MVSVGCAVCETTYPSPMRIWPSDVWTAAPDMTEPMAAHCAPIAGPQCCSQTPIHTRIKQQCPSPSSNRSSPGTSGPVAAQGRTGGVNPSNMCLRAAGCTSPTMVANDRDSVPGQFQSLLGCASPLWGSNPQPYAYEAHALPAELQRRCAELPDWPLGGSVIRQQAHTNCQCLPAANLRRGQPMASWHQWSSRPCGVAQSHASHHPSG